MTQATPTPSVEPAVRSRLLPRISFRVIFGITALAAIVYALARLAGQGGTLALSIMLALAFLIACFAAFFAAFLLAWCIALLTVQDRDDLAEGSPFASDQLPPQLLPPREPQP